MPAIIDVRREQRMSLRPSRDDADGGDDALVNRAREGDPEAWTEIVHTLGPRVRGYARGKGITDDDDVMQDVFLAAAQRVGEFEGNWRSFRSWIFSIAYRQIVNRYRAGPELPASLREEPQAAPEDEVVERQVVSAAVAALDVLNDLERDVVLLRVIAGLDTECVAAAVGKSPGNVRVIQSRAMTKVRAELIRCGFAVGTERSES